MSTRKEEQARLVLLQGTLDLLILRTLMFGQQHGQGIAPALQRLESREWIRAEWGPSDNNRKARFYALTRTGRKQLVAETHQGRRLAAAIGRILGPEDA